MKRQNITLKLIKPLFVERMQKLLSDKTDFNKYIKILNEPPRKSIRCNTLKISSEELLKRLEKKGWKISQPFKNNPEIARAFRYKNNSNLHSNITDIY